MILIVEPEKIKVVLFVVTIIMIIMVVMVISYSSYIIHDNSVHHKTPNYTYYNFANMGIFSGVSSYAFESIGSIFNVRRTMKKRSDMPKLQIWSFILVAASYYLTGLLVYLAYGNNGIKDMVFKYYSWATTPVMNSLGYVYCVTCLFNIPFNVISFVENFESLPLTRK